MLNVEDILSSREKRSECSYTATGTVLSLARAAALPRGGGHTLLHLRSRNPSEREFFTDNLLDRMHLIIEMILVDLPCAMGV